MADITGLVPNSPSPSPSPSPAPVTPTTTSKITDFFRPRPLPATDGAKDQTSNAPKTHVASTIASSGKATKPYGSSKVQVNKFVADRATVRPSNLPQTDGSGSTTAGPTKVANPDLKVRDVSAPGNNDNRPQTEIAAPIAAPIAGRVSIASVPSHLVRDQFLAIALRNQWRAATQRIGQVSDPSQPGAQQQPQSGHITPIAQGLDIDMEGQPQDQPVEEQASLDAMDAMDAMEFLNANMLIDGGSNMAEEQASASASASGSNPAHDPTVLDTNLNNLDFLSLDDPNQPLAKSPSADPLPDPLPSPRRSTHASSSNNGIQARGEANTQAHRHETVNQPTRSEAPHRRNTFKVGGGYENSSKGLQMKNFMSVERLQPDVKKYKSPIILIHGDFHDGQIWLTKPDGQPGWASYFLHHGYEVYLVDLPPNGRSMWLDDAHDVDIVPQNRMDPTYVEHSFTACALNPAWVSAKDHCQWPGAGTRGDPTFDSYMASIVPLYLGRSERQTMALDGLQALLTHIGEPVVLIGEGSGATAAFLVADMMPEVVAAIMAVEPTGPPCGGAYTEGNANQRAYTGRIWYDKSMRRYGLADIPMSYDPPCTDIGFDVSDFDNFNPAAASDYFGDVHPLDVTMVQTKSGKSCVAQGKVVRELFKLKSVPICVMTAQASQHSTFDWATVKWLKDAGCNVNWYNLEKEGIMGNGHLMFLEMNSDALANRVSGYITPFAGKLATPPAAPATMGATMSGISEVNPQHLAQSRAFMQARQGLAGGPPTINTPSYGDGQSSLMGSTEGEPSQQHVMGPPALPSGNNTTNVGLSTANTARLMDFARVLGCQPRLLVSMVHSQNMGIEQLISTWKNNQILFEQLMRNQIKFDQSMSNQIAASGSRASQPSASPLHGLPVPRMDSGQSDMSIVLATQQSPAAHGGNMPRGGNASLDFVRQQVPPVRTANNHMGLSPQQLLTLSTAKAQGASDQMIQRGLIAGFSPDQILEMQNDALSRGDDLSRRGGLMNMSPEQVQAFQQMVQGRGRGGSMSSDQMSMQMRMQMRMQMAQQLAQGQGGLVNMGVGRSYGTQRGALLGSMQGSFTTPDLSGRGRGMPPAASPGSFINAGTLGGGLDFSPIGGNNMDMGMGMGSQMQMQNNPAGLTMGSPSHINTPDAAAQAYFDHQQALMAAQRGQYVAATPTAQQNLAGRTGDTTVSMYSMAPPSSTPPTPTRSSRGAEIDLRSPSPSPAGGKKTRGGRAGGSSTKRKGSRAFSEGHEDDDIGGEIMVTPLPRGGARGGRGGRAGGAAAKKRKAASSPADSGDGAANERSPETQPTITARGRGGRRGGRMSLANSKASGKKGKKAQDDSDDDYAE